MATPIAKKETIFQKERRLKKRKQTYKETYKKGLFYNNARRLIEYLNQPDTVVRVHASGGLDDNTHFIQITIEGFVPPDSGI